MIPGSPWLRECDRDRAGDRDHARARDHGGDDHRFCDQPFCQLRMRTLLYHTAIGGGRSKL